MNNTLLFFMFIFPILFTGCMEKNTTDAEEAYMYWAGTKPPADVQVEKGQYWQSSHFTKEYIMYLKLKSTTQWWKLFVEQNNQEVKTDLWIRPDDTPAWFNPSKHCIQYGNNDDFDQGSRFFRDTLTGECYIYEIQL